MRGHPWAGKQHPLVLRRCKNSDCGREFKTLQPAARYCSLDCKQKHWVKGHEVRAPKR